jgi:hypothetical protein
LTGVHALSDGLLFGFGSESHVLDCKSLFVFLCIQFDLRPVPMSLARRLVAPLRSARPPSLVVHICCDTPRTPPVALLVKAKEQTLTDGHEVPVKAPAGPGPGLVWYADLRASALQSLCARAVRGPTRPKPRLTCGLLVLATFQYFSFPVVPDPPPGPGEMPPPRPPGRCDRGAAALRGRGGASPGGS